MKQKDTFKYLYAISQLKLKFIKAFTFSHQLKDNSNIFLLKRKYAVTQAEINESLTVVARAPVRVGGRPPASIKELRPSLLVITRAQPYILRRNKNENKLKL